MVGIYGSPCRVYIVTTLEQCTRIIPINGSAMGFFTGKCLAYSGWREQLFIVGGILIPVGKASFYFTLGLHRLGAFAEKSDVGIFLLVPFLIVTVVGTLALYGIAGRHGTLVPRMLKRGPTCEEPA